MGGIYIVIIAVVIGFVSWLLMEVTDLDEDLLPIGILVSILLLLFVFITWIISIIQRVETDPVIFEEYPLVSFSDGSNTSVTGSFLHISISSDSVYTFYYQLDNGGYKQMQLTVEDEDITIFETSERDPVIVKYQTKYTYKTKFMNFLWSADLDCYSDYFYEVYVPEGSVVQEFVLDMN